MPTASPSPSQKRPSMAERSSSVHSLSSSGKRDTSAPKVHRVTRHARNASHGKGLSKLGRVQSAPKIADDQRSQQRKKSGPLTPGHSPGTPVAKANLKRNSSHVVLPKNTSHGNLRKNHSAKELAGTRNVSHGNLKKLGLPPTPKPRTDKKQGFFELGNQSSGEDEENEWVDSTSQSPEMSRHQSKTSTPVRPRTPNGLAQVTYQDSESSNSTKLPSPPEPTLNNHNNRSAPNLKKPEPNHTEHPEQRLADPALLQHNSRASRAPPAMSTVSAQVKRTDSSRSLLKLVGEDSNTSNLNQSISGVGTSSSASAGVSHFLPSSSVATSRRSIEDDSDDDSPSGFMSHYKPQLSESPEKPRMLNKARIPSVPSRTQQKLELQRRETMRAGGAAPPTPGVASIALSGGSSVSLHSRSGSKGRIRSSAGDPKAMRHDYEMGVKHLTVVRRFKNPILDSLHRMQDNHVIPSDTASLASSAVASKSRPQSRRGVVNTNGNVKPGISRSPDEKRQPTTPGGGSGQRHSKVQFQMSRQGSHDDIGLTTSQGSPEDYDDEHDGISPEEALIRRIWESSYIRE